jgi:hypothetical protein
MLHIKELLSQLKADYPSITFVMGDDFMWSRDRRELTVGDAPDASAFALHELGHAVLGHADFLFDIELLRQEREAWEQAKKLAIMYKVNIEPDLIEDSLDTYRDWLHARSLCPACGLTGLQTKTSTYMCVNCRCSWHPNDARRVSLRRYKVT